MSKDRIARVHYFERQFLRTQDFTDEQAYHVAMRWRHHIAHHTWGIIRGLKLVVQAEGLFIQPGMAIDGYGRELILAEQRALPISAFAEYDRDQLDIWLEYDRLETDPAPLGYAGCSNSTDNTATLPYRWQEYPRVRLDLPDLDADTRRQPKGVLEVDLNFDPSRIPPDDPQQTWPVFLGQITRTRSKPDQPYTYSVDMNNRPYIGLVGEEIKAPSDLARIQIGADMESDSRRFAIFVPEANPQAGVLPSLEIQQNGSLDIRGESRLNGNLTVKGAIEFGVGAATGSSPPPWSIYRYSDDATNKHELRIAMAAGTGDNNQVVIGTWSASDQTFSPCLTIANDRSVTVHGNLIVNGTLTENQTRAEAQLSAGARNFLVSGLHSGVAGANVLLPRFYRGSFVTDSAPIGVASTAVESDVGIQAVIDSLANDPARLAAFVARLKESHSDLAEKLRNGLNP